MFGGRVGANHQRGRPTGRDFPARLDRPNANRGTATTIALILVTHADTFPSALYRSAISATMRGRVYE